MRASSKWPAKHKREQIKRKRTHLIHIASRSVLPDQQQCQQSRQAMGWTWCCCSCLPPLSDPQQARYQLNRPDQSQACASSRAPYLSEAGHAHMSSKATAAGRSCPTAAPAAAGAAHGPHPRSRRSLLQRRTHLQLWLLAVAALALLVGPAAGLPNVDISIAPPTAKSASVSYTWALAASAVPTQVTMAVTEAKSVSRGWVAVRAQPGILGGSSSVWCGQVVRLRGC